jgi:steroid delta-isomerase-like uncharacterized protein
VTGARTDIDDYTRRSVCHDASESSALEIVYERPDPGSEPCLVGVGIPVSRVVIVGSGMVRWSWWALSTGVWRDASLGLEAISRIDHHQEHADCRSHMAPQSAESNKAAAVRLYVETLDRHNPDVARELISESLVFHDAADEIRGRDGWMRFVGEWLTGFPDLRLTIDFSIAEQDRVLLHWRAQGTHTGPFRGRPATGRRIAASGLTLFRFSSGRIEEMWDEVAAFGELQTLTFD